VAITLSVIVLISVTIASISCKQEPANLPPSLTPPEEILQTPPQTEIATTRMEVGDIAPDFTLQSIDGETIILSEFHGKNIVLNFWVSTCPACLEELPYFETINKELPKDKTLILAVNAGERDKTVQYESERLKLTFPVLLDPDGKVCKSYGRGSPTTFFIDSEGIIKEIVDVSFEDSKEIDNILKLLRWY
jgi:peroxiredoxin